MANINDFYTKYQQFEQKQQLQFQQVDQSYNIKQLNSFKSDSYITNRTNNSNENLDLMKNHPIIDNLIERANKLKNEMSISTQNNNNNNNDPNISICYNNDESFISMLNYKNNYDPDLDMVSKQNSYIDAPSTTATSNFLFNNNLKNNMSFLHETNLNDISRLSDPLHDPELLSALLYSNVNNISNNFHDQSLNENNDIELNELLNPKHLKVDFNSIYEEPIKLDKNNDKINFSKSVSSSSVNNNNNRNRSVSRSSISSNDEYDLKKSSSSTRVSFEIQSSDGESSSSNLNNELKCIDVLSQDRLALLDLVQIAKLKIEKMCLFNLTNVSNLMERINNLEQYFNKSSTFNKSRSTTNLDPSLSKPPKAIKKQDTGQLFFIEYQFPVLANSRDNNNSSIFQQDKSTLQLATQVMRANSKNFRKQDENLINSEDVITYEHNADYSILFNPQLLESWWRSTIIFKIYARSPYLLNSSTNLASLNNNKINMPYLIGVARLNLRNLLKSRNFKLYKKLAVIDQLTELEYNTYPNLVNGTANNKHKRIGTLHVKLELLSDLKEFNTTLIKLNKKSNSLKFINGKKTSSTSSLLNNNTTTTTNTINNNNNNNRTRINKNTNKLEQPFEQSIKPTNTINKQQNQIVSYNEENDNEKFSIPIQMYLSINDGRGFKINNNLNNTSIYLICRLFWNREKIKFESTNTSSLFCWTLNLSFILKHSLLNKNMKNNYMILEAWQKKSKSSNDDSLLGTIKLPLHEFYLRFNDETFLRSFLAQSQSQPLIGVDGWISVCDPFTGQKTGEVNVLLAMGSNQQILNLTKILFDKSSFSSNMNSHSSNQSISSSSTSTSNLIEHIFTFKVESIKVHPIKTILNDTMTFDESNCFINYTFPTTITNSTNNQTQNDIKFIFNTYSIASKTNSNYYNKLEHRLILKKTTSLYEELINKFMNYFYGTSSYDQSSINSSDCFILFQIWSKSNYPNQREKLIANGQLPIDKLISVVKNSSININNRTFIVPLTNPNESILNNNNYGDKFVGQLHLTIEYRTDLLNYNLNSNLAQLEYFNNNNEDIGIFLNIGILRATGLQAAISHAICRNNLRSTLNVDQSRVYIKFSLSFLGRPNDRRQSKLISTTLNGYSPEFFDYFDIACPLISTCDQINNQKISLAEQLEYGKIIFELWYRNNETNNNQPNDTLLGTCIVSLESLLDINKTGIRGWLPIKSSNFMDTCLLEQIVNDSENNKQIGGLELSIRFTKSDDVDRVIEAAREIGWFRPNELFPRSNENNIINRRDLYLNSHNLHQQQQQKGTVKCLIEIEKAVHLPKIYDQKTKKHNPPNSFISFNISIDDPSQIAQTTIVESQSSPIWNYQLLVHIDKEFFLDEQKYFIMKVNHAIEPSSLSYESNQMNSKCIGSASIDLTPLICGLSHISGWYNIQDSIGNCQGQLKINILPQENLFALKEFYLNRKNKILGNNGKNINIKQFDHFRSNSSLNSFNNQPSSFEYMVSTTTNNLNPYDFTNKVTQQQSYSNSTLSSNHSNSSSNFKEIINDSQDLKSGLFQKLNELDELNKVLKERLEKKNTNQRLSFYSNENNTIKQFTDQIQKETINDNQNNLIQLNATQQEIIKIVNNNNNSDNIALENITQNIEKEPLLANIDETTKFQTEQSQTVFDSFWLNNSDGFNLQMQVKEKLSQIEEFVKNYEEEFKNEMPPHLPPPHALFQKQKSIENINTTTNASHLNDTEYDQTFNLNASYEIVPNKNSEFIKIASNESVDRIIDCSKLDNNDEINNNNNNYYGQENDEEEELIIVNKDDEEINNNDSINEENNQYLNGPIDNQEDGEENVTVIVPEELNKIDEVVTETEKIQLNNHNEESPKITSNITTTATTTIKTIIENVN